MLKESEYKKLEVCKNRLQFIIRLRDIEYLSNQVNKDVRRMRRFIELNRLPYDPYDRVANRDYESQLDCVCGNIKRLSYISEKL